MKVVTFYSKPDCQLCQEMKQVIAQVARRRRFKLLDKNILDNAGDLEKYKTAVPVILVDGQEIARHRLTAYQLETALTREME